LRFEGSLDQKKKLAKTHLNQYIGHGGKSGGTLSEPGPAKNARPDLKK
jgi:hypothetical protein